MCILLCTVSHPDYAFLLGSNRDEFFSRPTERAQFVDGKYLMPVDLAREEHGTWIGVSKTGRFCALVNYRETIYPCQMGAISRGRISRDFLESNLDPVVWAEDIRKRTDDFADIGGFSMLFGILSASHCENSLYVISNRVDGLVKPFVTGEDGDKVLGLSNSSIFQPWPKVFRGKELMNTMLAEQREQDRDAMVDRMFDIMSDSYEGMQNGSSMADNIVDNVRRSVFVPALSNDLPSDIERRLGPYYGTRTQTVILLTHEGHLTYAERDISPNGPDNDNGGGNGEAGICHMSRFDFELT